jgi:sialic acid synthase SpsE
MTDAFQIAGRPIGPGAAPFVIAEMSGNHNQSLDRALAIVDAAAEGGRARAEDADLHADTMTLDLDEREFHIADPNSLWAGTSLYKLYGEAYTPWEWHAPIFNARVRTGHDGLQHAVR